MAWQTPGESKPHAALSDYLAVERTFLAWIRTGLALMGFGFVVARFGLFLQTLQATEPTHPVPVHGISPWFGTALIFAGVIVNLVAAWQHLQMIGALNRGDVSPRSRPMLAVTVAIFLALVGLAMAIYLLSLRTPATGEKETTRESTMSQPAANIGIVNLASNHSVDETVAKFKAILEAKGVKLFALVDHSGEAPDRGWRCRPPSCSSSAAPRPAPR
jgi:putative membrane protein